MFDRFHLTDDERIDFTNHIPPTITQEVVDYTKEIVFAGSRYLFVRRVGKVQYGYCTHCEREYPTGATLKHNSRVICFECGKEVTVKAAGISRKRLVDERYFVWYDKSRVDPKTVVALGIYAVRDYRDNYYRVQTQFETITMYIFEPGRPRMIKRWAYYRDKGEIYAGGWEKTRTVHSVWNHGHIANIPSVYSRNRIPQIVEGTSFQYSCWEQYDYEDMTRFFGLFAKYPCIEYLTKLGMKDLVNSKLMETDSTLGAINWNGKTLLKVLKLTKQEFSEIRKRSQNITFFLLHILQTSRKFKWGLSMDEVQEINYLDSPYYLKELLALTRYAPMKKILAYLAKQRAKNQKQYRELSGALTAWRDYIRDCIKLETLPDQRENQFPECDHPECPFHECMPGTTCRIHNVAKEGLDMLLDYGPDIDYCERPALYLRTSAVLFPKNLYRAHQNTIKQIKIKADEELKRQIAERNAQLKHYQFKFKGLFIRAAASAEELIAEGKALNHCVGGYASGHASGRTTILFIRKTSAPAKPFFTVEVRNDAVIQVRGNHNCNPDEEVKEFIEEFKARKLTKKPKVKKSA